MAAPPSDLPSLGEGNIFPGKASLRFPQLSLVDLSPINGPIPRGHLLVVLKSYFDAANQSDSTQYDVITLASVSGVPGQWRPFEREWKSVLKKHGAPYLHTTDVVSLANHPFTKANGWDERRRDAFISDCASVLEDHTFRPRMRRLPNGKPGLVPHVYTVKLKDFVQATAANPDVPRSVDELCAVQSLARLDHIGQIMGAHFYQLYFDRNERFRGHIEDRRRNRKARQNLAPMIDRIQHCGESDMRDVPALQMADLYAWSFSHKSAVVRFEWQRRVLRQGWWIEEFMDYPKLIKIIPGVADVVRSWRLPQRRATR